MVNLQVHFWAIDMTDKPIFFISKLSKNLDAGTSLSKKFISFFGTVSSLNNLP
jgi:hypothetical protein